MSNTRQYEEGDIVDITLHQDNVKFSFTVKLRDLTNGNISARMLTGDIEAVEQLVLDNQLEQSLSVQSDISSQLLLMEADLWSKIAGDEVNGVVADDITDAFRMRYIQGDK